MSNTVNTGNRRHQRGRHRAKRTQIEKNISTTDHATIRQWIEERGGKPAVVKGSCDEIRILRIQFPDSELREKADELGWDEFFALFEAHDMEFLYQEKTPDGKQSRFGRFVPRIS
jgi:hypothetical protein